MTAAIKAVQEGQSISQAARDHGVPKTTLYDRVSGRVTYGTSPGPQLYLNSQEEKEPGTYLKLCAKVGCGKTRRDVLTIVETAAGRRGEPPRARVLTSATAFEMLKEKEGKKQKEAEMKEKKRKEREEMKKRKEEDQRKKAEERARKQEQRAKEKAEKEAQRAKNAKQPATVGAKRGPNTRSTRPSKCPRMEISLSEQVNDNKCCVCFVLYENDQSGKDWVACACGRWLHEDCADDCVIDSDGNERLCFICLNNL